MERHVYPWTVVSVSLHYKNQAQCVGLVQSGHHLIENRVLDRMVVGLTTTCAISA